MNHWVYSAVITAMGSAALGFLVSGLVIRRVFHGHNPKPAIALLLFALLGLSVSQLVEQSRVLIFRASFDGLVESGLFHSVYNSTWNVVSSKVLLAISMAVAAAVNLGLYCDRDDREILAWTVRVVIGTIVMWIALAMALNPLI